MVSAASPLGRDPLVDLPIAPVQHPSSRPSGPAEALADLLGGNRRFIEGRPRFGHLVTSPGGRSSDHSPYALVLGCLDARVAPEAIFDQDAGSITVVRTGGHVVDTVALASVEFAVSVFEVSLVVVLGHQYCGAVRAAIKVYQGESRPPDPIGALVDGILPAASEAGGAEGATIHQHVIRTADRLRESVSATVVGAYYEIDSGRVRMISG